MSKAILYAVNTANQTMSATTGTVVGFDSIVRKYGCNIYLSGGNVVINGKGYYEIDTNLSVTSTSAGTMSVSVYKDGTIVPGATSMMTVASGDTTAVTIPAIVRDLCDCESTITIIISGITGTINNSAIDVIKL